VATPCFFEFRVQDSFQTAAREVQLLRLIDADQPAAANAG
jgi:hypothetical protein